MGEREEMVDREVARQLDTVKRFNYLLRDFDHRLDLVFIGERADGVGLTPGRWHVRRRNDGAPDTYMAITGPRGEYSEPHSGVFDMLAKADLWRDGNMKRAREAQLREAKAKERAAQAKRDELREEFALRLKAKLSPGIRFGGSWRSRLGDG